LSEGWRSKREYKRSRHGERKQTGLHQFPPTSG
jgi:hypothetical protein